MATTLKAFQQEISSIADQKKAEHFRELRQAQQVATERSKGAGGAHKPSPAGTGGGHIKGKSSKDVKDVKDLNKGKENKKEGEIGGAEDTSVDEPEVSIEVSELDLGPRMRAE
jgi:hypothetical protein